MSTGETVVINGKVVRTDSTTAHRDVRDRLAAVETLAIPHELSGTTLKDSGFTEPENDVVDVYVMGQVLASEPVVHPSLGNDSNDGLTKATPLLTIDGVRRMVGRRGIEGKRIVVHLAGGGWVDGVSGVTDPWDGQCTSMRQYPVRSIFLGGSEAHMNSWCFRGPRKMQVLAETVINDFTAAPGNAGRTRWAYTGAGGTGNAWCGYYLHVFRDGAEVSQPIQITESDATYFYTDHGAYFQGQGIYDWNDTFKVVQRAAEFIPTANPGDTGGADSIAMQGWGAFNTHARLSSVIGFEDGRNPPFSFERLGFENLNVMAVPGVSFDCCYFYHQFSVRGGWAEFNGCTVESQVPTYMCCETRGIGTATESQEFGGRAVVDAHASPPAGDPLWPSLAGPGLFGFRGGPLMIGADYARGVFRVWKGLSWNGGIVVRGQGSAFIMPNDSHAVHIREANIGLHCRDGAMATVDPSVLFLVNVVASLKVGIGATIALGTGVGQFSEVAGWNGNFTRHLEGTATHPTGDLSRIADSRIWGDL